MGIKLIALDLDGTSLNRENKIDELTMKVLTKAHNMKIKIVIATGRNYESVPRWIKDLEFIDYIIASNGAELRATHTDEVLYESHIDSKKIEELCAFLQKKENMVEIFSEGIGYIGEKDFKDISCGKIAYRNIEYVVNTRKPVENIYKFMIEKKNSIENINIFVEKLEDKKDFIIQLSEIDEITITSSFPNNIEIGARDTNKATGIKKLADIMKISKNQTLAMGDNINDIEMIKYSAIGIAMGNAEKEVKEVADYITDTNDNSGVAKALLKFEIVDGIIL